MKWRWNGNDDVAKCDINEVRLMTMKVIKNQVITIVIGENKYLKDISFFAKLESFKSWVED